MPSKADGTSPPGIQMRRGPPGTAALASFVATEVIPERSVTIFAAKNLGQKAMAIKSAFEARKQSKPDHPKLVGVAAKDATAKLG